jgi:hypothetical protein
MHAAVLSEPGPANRLGDRLESPRADEAIDEPSKVHKDDQAYSKDDGYHCDLAIRDNDGPVLVPAGHLYEDEPPRHAEIDIGFHPQGPPGAHPQVHRLKRRNEPG